MRGRRTISNTLNHRSSFAREARPWRTAAWTITLAAAVLLVHGFHPAAEDGGIYVTGIYLRLDGNLFPHDAAFVRAPMAYSQFAWLMADTTKALHLSVPWTVFIAYVLTVAWTLFSAKRIVRICGCNQGEQLGAIALLAAWWTLPVAGTSLNIGDPYLTARSFSMPLSLLAASFALERWRNERGDVLWRPVAWCVFCLVLTACMHTLMFGFIAVFIVLLRLRHAEGWRQAFVWFASASLLFSGLLCKLAPPESAAFLRAELTREYWFISAWQWYELFGLLAPLLLFAVLAKKANTQEMRQLAQVCLAAGALSVCVAFLFARESAGSHIVARLQPLRMFVLLYALMSALMGATLVRFFRNASSRQKNPGVRRLLRYGQMLAVAGGAAVMFAVQRNQYSSSAHLELPGRHNDAVNPWVAAFSWCRENTARNALFAIDPSYIHLPEDDAQTFRAVSQRSALPDQSKDGGEAAVDSALAEAWQTGMDAQSSLNAQVDAEREARLRPLGVSWMVLTAEAQTNSDCPYRNTVVKVCKLPFGH